MDSISIIIPNWNGMEKLRKHLPNVLKASQFSKVNEVIVVDDGSNDDSVEILENEFPQIKLIKKDKNSGFSSTVNLGVQSCSGDLVVLLNNDASPQIDFLKFALPHFENKKVFSVGCNVGNGGWAAAYFKDGFFWHNQQGARSKQSHLTLWASGGSGIFRKKIWQELHGLDALFDPFYEEDLDLGYRAYKRGYISIWEPRAKVNHYQEEGVISLNFSRNEISAVAQRNQLIFIWKNITSQEMINKHRVALVKKLIAHPKYWGIFLSALVKLPQILIKRETEKLEAKLADEQVLAIFA